MNASSNFLPLIHLVRLHYSVFFGKIRSLPPLIVWGIMLYLAYEPLPMNIVQGYLSTSIFLFFAMVWFGYLFLSDFDTTTEHLLITQVNSRLLCSVSKVLFLLAVLLAVSLVGSIFPIIIDLSRGLRGLTQIPYGISPADFLGGLILHFITGSLGIAIAFLFQPNPYKSDNITIVAALIMFALTALIKHQVFPLDTPASYILIIFTPLYEILSFFGDSNTFTARYLALSAFYSFAYFCTAMVVGYWLYNKRVYGPRIAKVCQKLMTP